MMTGPDEMTQANGSTGLPRIALILGAAGLLPQIAVVLTLLTHAPATRFGALALGYAYAALIFSFLGGLWWGIAAKSAAPPAWVWIAAVLPSLVALATAWPWMVGLAWPGPSLIVLGLGLIAALGVDVALVKRGLAPRGWLTLRLPLSLGLGGLTILTALL